MLLTIESIISKIKEDKPEMPAGGGIGGMGGMGLGGSMIWNFERRAIGERLFCFLAVLICAVAAPGCFTLGTLDDAESPFLGRSLDRVGIRGDKILIEYAASFSGQGSKYVEYVCDTGALRGRLLEDFPTTQVSESAWPTERLRNLAKSAVDVAIYDTPPPDVRWLQVRRVTWASSRTDGMECFIDTGQPYDPSIPTTEPAEFGRSLELEYLPLEKSAVVVVVPDRPPRELSRRRSSVGKRLPLTVAADIVTLPAQAALLLIGIPFFCP